MDKKQTQNKHQEEKSTESQESKTIGNKLQSVFAKKSEPSQKAVKIKEKKPKKAKVEEKCSESSECKSGEEKLQSSFIKKPKFFKKGEKLMAEKQKAGECQKEQTEESDEPVELVSEEIPIKSNFIGEFTTKISSIPQGVYGQIEKLFGEDDKYDVLTYRLLSYLNNCLGNGEIADWNYIMREDGEEPLLPVHERYRNYLLEHLLVDGYVEGFVVEEKFEGKERVLKETFGIQITPQGKKYLKENNAMRKAVKIIAEIIPGGF